MKSIIHKIITLSALAMVISTNVAAQMEWNGQLVQRAEYRHGFGKLIAKGSQPSTFISQRLRLQGTYSFKHFQLFASVQDIRTWGSTAQTKLTDGLLSVHEGWASVSLDSSWSVKLGRQELNYDNVRFLGNLDWALQARAHDFALLKYEKVNHKLHLGFGYNQLSENLAGNSYTLANQYKTAQMLWYNYNKSSFELSFLFWNNGKEVTKADTVAHTVSQSINYMHTFGIPTLKYSPVQNIILSAFAYFQSGKDVAGKKVTAFDLGAQTAQTINLNSAQQQTLKFALGVEILSGTANNSSDGKNRSFAPLYGTNHVHNGYMDYFFVGGRFDNSVGLNDIFAKVRYDHNKRWFVAADLHHFSANAKVYQAGQLQGSKLGLETDLTGGCVFNEALSLQVGYSQMFAGSTLKYIQASSASNRQNWIYAMFIVRPKNNKKIHWYSQLLTMELKGKAALKIADIVSANIQTAHVFKKYGIDFCCGGGITIERACQKGNIDMDLLHDDLKNIGENVLQSQNFNNWKLDFLVDYIVNTHHAFVTESLELINAYVAKVCTVHGAAHPAVVKIKEKFELVAADLWAHMQKEERILFPYIKELVVANGRQIAFVPPPFGTIRNPILQMEEEHEFVGKLLKEIDALSDNYTPPEWACNTFKALYAKLSEFEQDLHLHIHLENNILFPKAIAMEQKLTKTITE